MNLTRLGFASLILVTVATSHAQTGPRLADYYTLMRAKVIDPSYSSARGLDPAGSFSADLNGNGFDDLVVFGVDAPPSPCCGVPQPGRVLFGDGDGNFIVPAPDIFPTDTFKMVDARKVLFADLNGDGRLDIFIACHGWDADPLPGEQNRLYLSEPGGGWREATASLPQISDYTHSAAVGDIRGVGVLDIIAGNHPLFPKNPINPYVLVNDGTGRFTMTQANIPVGPGQLMDGASGHFFVSTTLADLNGDGFPDLILGTDTPYYSQLTHSTVLWNHGGTFSESNKTDLPAPAAFSATHIDLDIQAIDFNGDGLPDLVIVGSQVGANVFYDGWFVQLLQNQGNGTFVDVTASYLAPSDTFGGTPGVATGSPWPLRVKVLDFNGDGLPDFAVEYYAPAYGWSNQDLGLPGDLGVFGGHLPPSQPLIYLNDGKGHFSTLKVGDFVAPGYEQALGGGHLMRTRNGYSFITPNLGPGTNGDFRPGLRLTGLLATKPYRSPPLRMVEYYNAKLDHYFMTWPPPEIAALDAGTISGWSRTGAGFNAFATAQPGTSPVCRYYIPPAFGDSHFFGRGTAECTSTGQKNPSFILEDPQFIQMYLPTLGVCPGGTSEVYRVFDNRPDANHRYMTDKAVRDQMVAKGWIAEGDGPNLVVMCAPQ